MRIYAISLLLCHSGFMNSIVLRVNVGLCLLYIHAYNTLLLLLPTSSILRKTASYCELAPSFLLGRRHDSSSPKFTRFFEKITSVCWLLSLRVWVIMVTLGVHIRVLLRHMSSFAVLPISTTDIVDNVGRSGEGLDSVGVHLRTFHQLMLGRRNVSTCSMEASRASQWLLP